MTVIEMRWYETTMAAQKSMAESLKKIEQHLQYFVETSKEK